MLISELGYGGKKFENSNLYGVKLTEFHPLKNNEGIKKKKKKVLQYYGYIVY